MSHLRFIVIVLCFSFTAVNQLRSETPPMQTSKLFLTLPGECPTPDGMAVDAEGRLCLACPNFADQSKPGCVMRITKEMKIEKWFDVPVLPETGVACPMGIEFGPDGEVYLCDNQPWMGSEKGRFKGRLLRCRVQGVGKDARIETHVVAEGIEHPNGVRFHHGMLYVTNSLMSKVKHPSGLLISGVYRFDPKAENTVKVENTLEDPNLLLHVLTYNKDCQYGLDGLAFDKRGDLYLGNFGDGSILKVVFDSKGGVATCETWAKDPKNLRTTDGICFDEKDNLYIADFSDNAVAVVTPEGKVYRLACSPDSDGAGGELDQPGEPIVWNGKLVISCFDCVTGPDKVNTKHDKPFTLTSLDLLP